MAMLETAQHANKAIKLGFIWLLSLCVIEKGIRAGREIKAAPSVKATLEPKFHHAAVRQFSREPSRVTGGRAADPL